MNTQASAAEQRVERLLTWLYGIGLGAWVVLNLLIWGLLWIATEFAPTRAVDAARAVALLLVLTGLVVVLLARTTGDGSPRRAHVLGASGLVAIGAPSALALAQILFGVLSA